MNTNKHAHNIPDRVQNDYAYHFCHIHTNHLEKGRKEKQRRQEEAEKREYKETARGYTKATETRQARPNAYPARIFHQPPIESKGNERGSAGTWHARLKIVRNAEDCMIHANHQPAYTSFTGGRGVCWHQGNAPAIQQCTWQNSRTDRSASLQASCTLWHLR